MIEKLEPSYPEEQRPSPEMIDEKDVLSKLTALETQVQQLHVEKRKRYEALLTVMDQLKRDLSEQQREVSEEQRQNKEALLHVLEGVVDMLLADLHKAISGEDADTQTDSNDQLPIRFSLEQLHELSETSPRAVQLLVKLGQQRDAENVTAMITDTESSYRRVVRKIFSKLRRLFSRDTAEI